MSPSSNLPGPRRLTDDSEPVPLPRRSSTQPPPARRASPELSAVEPATQESDSPQATSDGYPTPLTGKHIGASQGESEAHHGGGRRGSVAIPDNQPVSTSTSTHLVGRHSEASSNAPATDAGDGGRATPSRGRRVEGETASLIEPTRSSQSPQPGRHANRDEQAPPITDDPVARRNTVSGESSARHGQPARPDSDERSNLAGDRRAPTHRFVGEGAADTASTRGATGSSNHPPASSYQASQAGVDSAPSTWPGSSNTAALRGTPEPQQPPKSTWPKSKPRLDPDAQGTPPPPPPSEPASTTSSWPQSKPASNPAQSTWPQSKQQNQPEAPKSTWPQRKPASDSLPAAKSSAAVPHTTGNETSAPASAGVDSLNPFARPAGASQAPSGPTTSFTAESDDTETTLLGPTSQPKTVSDIEYQFNPPTATGWYPVGREPSSGEAKTSRSLIPPPFNRDLNPPAPDLVVDPFDLVSPDISLIEPVPVLPDQEPERLTPRRGQSAPQKSARRADSGRPKSRLRLAILLVIVVAVLVGLGLLLVFFGPSSSQRSTAGSGEGAAATTVPASPIAVDDAQFNIPENWEIYQDEQIDSGRRAIWLQEPTSQVRLQVTTLADVPDATQACDDLVTNQAADYTDVSYEPTADISVSQENGSGVTCGFSGNNAEGIATAVTYTLLTRTSDSHVLLLRSTVPDEQSTSWPRNQLADMNCQASTSFGVALPLC